MHTDGENCWRSEPVSAPIPEAAPMTPTLDEARLVQIVNFLGDKRKTQPVGFTLSPGDCEVLRALGATLPGLFEAATSLGEARRKLASETERGDHWLKTATVLGEEREQALKRLARYDDLVSTMVDWRTTPEQGHKHTVDGSVLRQLAGVYADRVREKT